MKTTNRRDFLKKASAAGAGIVITPQFSNAGISKAKKKKDEVNIAFIGIGLRGIGHSEKILANPPWIR
ncbi:MAG: twin-arginine translocation signal domain-containing protein [Bacteroidales bacterium]